MAQKSVKSLNTPAYDRLVEQLKRGREKAGLTPYAVAKAMGEDPTFVYKVESKERRLDVVELVALCRACGIDPLDFFGSWLASLPQGKE